MMLGSSANGIANWPALPVVTFRLRCASACEATRTASTSAGVKRRCPLFGSAIIFPNAVL
jgi:hypothetical protein